MKKYFLFVTLLLSFVCTAQIGVGIIASGIQTGTSPYDANAQAYITRVQRTGVVLTTWQKNAVNDYTVGIKSDGIFSKGYANHLPVVCGDSTAHSINLIDTSTYQITWVGDPVHSFKKVRYNGTSQYGNTGLAPNVIGQNSISFGVGIPTATGTGASSGTDISSTTGSVRTSLYVKYANDATFYSYVNTFSPYATGAMADAVGLTVSNRTSSTASQVYKNGVDVGDYSDASTTPSTYPFYVGASNDGGSAGQYVDRFHDFYWFGQGLTPTEQTNLYDRLEALRDSIYQNLVASGNSNTQGTLTGSANADSGMINRTLIKSHYNFTVNNLGASGWEATNIIATMRDVFPAIVNHRTTYLVTIGGNDYGTGSTGDSVYSRLVQISDYVKSLGCTRIIVSTQFEFGDLSAPAITQLNIGNQLIRDNAVANGWVVADLRANADIGQYNPTFYHDFKHLGDLGADIAADIFLAAINSFEE